MGRITHVYGCRPGMGKGKRSMARGDPIELIKFWCLSGFGYGSRASFYFTFLNIRWVFYTIYCHSPDGDAVRSALTEFALSRHVLLFVGSAHAAHIYACLLLRRESFKVTVFALFLTISKLYVLFTVCALNAVRYRNGTVGPCTAAITHIWLEMPIQAPKNGGFGGLWTPKCDYSSSRPPKGTSLRKIQIAISSDLCVSLT